MPINYLSAGVDVEKGEEAIRRIKPSLQSTWNEKIVADVTGFQAVYDNGDHYVIGATDGVGTKLLVAIRAGKYDTIGQDLVAMCANDLARVGASPMFFLNYYAAGKLSEQQHYAVVASIAQACKSANIPLIGGETAEMPGLYRTGEFDVAGFAVGRVDKDKILDGNGIRTGMPLLGIQSSGLHSNGYSLARAVIFENLDLGINAHIRELGGTIGNVLLEPTLLYTKPILELLDTFPGQIQSMAHITGGGMPSKLPKALPDGLGARVKENWPVHPIFKYIQTQGKVSNHDMQHTFNMGIGMVAVVKDAGTVPEMQDVLKNNHGLESYVIGEVTEGKGVHYD